MSGGERWVKKEGFENEGCAVYDGALTKGGDLMRGPEVDAVRCYIRRGEGVMSMALFDGKLMANCCQVVRVEWQLSSTCCVPQAVCLSGSVG